MLIHRLLLQPTPLLSLPLLQKSLQISLQTTSFCTANNYTVTSISSLPTRFLPSSPSFSLCARFSSEALLQLRKDVENEFEISDGEFGAEETQEGLERVLESRTNEELKYNTNTNTNTDTCIKLPNLSVKEKKELASYAHSLGKKLKSQQVGKSGVTDTVVAALIETLEANELLKLKIHNNCPGELDDVVKQLEEGTGSVVVGRIGRTVILYRPSLTKLKVEEKKKQARRVLVKKLPTSTQFQSKSQAPRRSSRGRRGSSRVSG